MLLMMSATAMGQQRWGNGDGDDRLIAIAMAPGQGHWGRSNWGKSNRSSRRQWQWGNDNDRSFPLHSINGFDQATRDF
jgi:hypothetical protein